MNSDILVSISCITYNHSDYIRKAIDGFLMQKTDFRFEILIHDDCSTDGTTEIIKEYERDYPDLIFPIYEQENQFSKGGPIGSAVWNVPRARGKYIALCEGDDYWVDPLKLQKQVDILEEDETLMAVVTNSKVVDKVGNELKAKQDNVVPYNKEGRYDLRSFMYKIHHYPTATVCYRRTHVEEIEKMSKHLANPYLGDWTTWISLHIFGDFYYLDEVTSAYRINPTSLTHTVDRVGRSKANWTICKAVQDILPDEYDDIRKRLDKNSWMWVDLALAYRHEHQYIRMLRCCSVAFLKDPKGLLYEYKRRKKLRNSINSNEIQ
jgi:glycosyltransferase involved in cell wall biosynthesis